MPQQLNELWDITETQKSVRVGRLATLLGGVQSHIDMQNLSIKAQRDTIMNYNLEIQQLRTQLERQPKEEEV